MIDHPGSLPHDADHQFWTTELADLPCQAHSGIQLAPKHRGPDCDFNYTGEQAFMRLMVTSSHPSECGATCVFIWQPILAAGGQSLISYTVTLVQQLS